MGKRTCDICNGGGSAEIIGVMTEHSRKYGYVKIEVCPNCYSGFLKEAKEKGWMLRK